MIDVAVLRAMAAAGATVEVIIAAVEAAQAVEQKAADERRAKDAERKRRSRGHRVTSRDTAGHERTDTDGVGPPSKVPPTTPLITTPSDPEGSASDAEKELFKRGKEILGANAGGLIAKLLKAKKRNIPLARAALETASTKQNAREYVGAAIAGGVPSEGGRRLSNDDAFYGQGNIPGVI